MSDLHIDDFYRDTAKALVLLYNQFPRKTILYVEDIAGPDTPDEFGLHSQRHSACFYGLLWLAEQGYLGYESPIQQEALDQSQLSHRSFLWLQTPLNTDWPALEGPLIQQLRQLLKQGSSNQITACMRQAMALFNVRG